MKNVSADSIARQIKAETVLLAISAEWKDQAAALLQEKGITTLIAPSLEEAKALIDSQGVEGMIVTSDWAIAEDQEGLNLIEAVGDKMPIVTLILQETFAEMGNRIFERVFFLPRHQFCTVPFDLFELLARMQRGGM